MSEWVGERLVHCISPGAQTSHYDIDQLELESAPAQLHSLLTLARSRPHTLTPTLTTHALTKTSRTRTHPRSITKTTRSPTRQLISKTIIPLVLKTPRSQRDIRDGPTEKQHKKKIKKTRSYEATINVEGRTPSSMLPFQLRQQQRVEPSHPSPRLPALHSARRP